MFERILIANRGEIALRVIRTAREMGIECVAVYSDVDSAALHTRMARVAVPLGGKLPSESYLDMDKVIAAAKETGAQAIHPGYGFLSENATFARKVKEAGIAWIGPPEGAITTMGDKIISRRAMKEAGVPTVPGLVDPVDDVATAVKEAEAIGYPIAIKAAAGGGGKGIRVVRAASEMESAFRTASGEAVAAFGDGRLYLERYLDRPRHIEVQVMFDQHGHGVHFFERECSIQRRHQKLVEEAPSVVLDEEMRAKVGEIALRAGRAVNYEGAGTVEFLWSGGEIFFLEMNTRLQVEHPITELITGMDLVREQVRVAAGEPLGYTQDDIQRRGAAIQCRVYAEDPATGFLPSPGTIEVLRQPHGPGVRDDSGAYGGAEIPSFYDPLVSKLCVWAPTRELAVQRMRRALTEYVVTGIQTNLPFHLRLMEHEEFVAGQYDTGFIDRHRDALLKGEGLGAEARALTIAAAVAQAFRDADAAKAAQGQNGQGPGQAGPSPWRMGAIARLH